LEWFLEDLSGLEGSLDQEDWLGLEEVEMRREEPHSLQ
jgi:hypothetical protein